MTKLYPVQLAVAAFAVLALDVASPAKAAVLDYAVDGTYNNGLGTVSGTFDVDATTDAVEAIDVTVSASGGVNAFTYTDPSAGNFQYGIYSSTSFYNLSGNDGGNQLSLAFDQGGGDLITTGFGHSYVGDDFGPQYVVSGTITEGASAAAPEPSTWTMMILGLFGLGFMARPKRKSDTSFAAV